MKLAGWIAAVALIVGAFAVVALMRVGTEPVGYLTEPVASEATEANVVTTGTVVPLDEVEVGSVLSGQIEEVLVDFNAEVVAGQPLARLDPQSFLAQRRERVAELQIARANLEMSRAAVEKAEAAHAVAKAAHMAAEARLVRARATQAQEARRLDRAESLGNRGVVSEEAQLDAETGVETSAADVGAAEADVMRTAALSKSAEVDIAMARADVRRAEAEVERQEALLEQSEVNVERTTIRAPAAGVVISRDVQAGQTVAASLEAPKLFVIARDLREMSVHLRVDEADIGQIRPGQRARFEVDAYRDRTFEGTVSEIRKAPSQKQGVVTYAVVVTAPNADLLLLPGMTAIVDVEIFRGEGALRIPNAALGFQPPTLAAPEMDPPPGDGDAARVWVLDAGKPVPIDIRIGANDGRTTVMTAGSLSEGAELIVGTAPAHGQ